MPSGGEQGERAKVERETGIEPATNGLGSRDSTTELLPLRELLMPRVPPNLQRWQCPPDQAGRCAIPVAVSDPGGIYLQRNQRRASPKDMHPQSASTSKRPPCAHSGVPSRMLARKASFKAVSGRALMSG